MKGMVVNGKFPIRTKMVIDNNIGQISDFSYLGNAIHQMKTSTTNSV
jgi:hypothetical protein